MTAIRCSRCGSLAAALDRPPLPGEDGRRVHERVCRSCWEEWLGVQIKLINEQKLNPATPEHYRRLIGEMNGFFGLGEDPR